MSNKIYIYPFIFNYCYAAIFKDIVIECCMTCKIIQKRGLPFLFLEN